MTWDEIIMLLAAFGLAIVAVRGLWIRFARARRAQGVGRWDTLAAYGLGLAAGLILGIVLAIETDWLWSLCVSLGLGASVVGGRWLGKIEPGGSVPRKPGHGEDV